MSRREVFDAIKAARGKGYNTAEVALVDALLDQLGVARETPDGALEPSPQIKKFIKDIEKLARVRPDGMVEAYMPTPNDVPTIGYGSTGPDITLKTVWTKAQCEDRFDGRLASDAAQIRAMLDGAPTTQGQFDAMLSLAYNIGMRAFRDSTLLRLHREGKYAAAADQFPRWNKQAGVVLNGLTKRRAAERLMYQDGV